MERKKRLEWEEGWGIQEHDALEKSQTINCKTKKQQKKKTKKNKREMSLLNCCLFYYILKIVCLKFKNLWLGCKVLK